MKIQIVSTNCFQTVAAIETRELDLKDLCFEKVDATRLVSGQGMKCNIDTAAKAFQHTLPQTNVAPCRSPPSFKPFFLECCGAMIILGM